MSDSIAQKRCSKCKEVKKLNCYPRDRYSSDGLNSWCRDCRSRADREYRYRVRNGIPHPKEYDREKTHKVCSVCNQLKSVDCFYFRVDGEHNQFDSRCKSCRKDYVSGGKPRNRDLMLRRVYGISQYQYEVMLSEQAGVCACCGKPETHKNAHTGEILPLAVDHDHKSGEVRALLCGDCNRAYGMLKEDESRILSLLAYHRRFHPSDDPPADELTQLPLFGD
jgi:hypothetical protein